MAIEYTAEFFAFPKPPAKRKPGVVKRGKFPVGYCSGSEEWRRREVCRTPAAWSLRRRMAILRDGKRCTACGTAVTFEDGQVDHVIARGMGGGRRDDSLANLRTLCAGCHEARHRPAAMGGGNAA